MTRFAALALTALSLTACSALLHPENYPIACSGTGSTDTCAPFGLTCVDGICQSVDGGTPPDGCGMQESCNGLDDNCNGVVDEGSEFDADMDGFTWCGTVSHTTPGPTDHARADCNDSDPSVYPGAPEICDGKDNNCNGMIDEANPNLCPGGLVCSPVGRACFAVGDCTAPENHCSPGFMCNTTTSPPSCETGDCTLTGAPPCPGSSHCNPDTHACVVPGEDGTPCAGDSDCLSGLCFDTVALNLPSASPSGRLCGKACCGDSDCGAQEVCWTPGTGARSCLPRMVLDRAHAGGGVSGSSCGGGGDCSSGLCDSAGIGCVGACGASSQCMGLTCALAGPIPIGGGAGHDLLSCITPPSGAHGDPGDACCTDAACKSGICLDAFPPGSGCVIMGECSSACRTSADCPRSFDFGTGYCSYGHTTDTMDALQVCFYRYTSGSGGHTGESCSVARDCTDGDCEAGICHDACCVDGDCSGGTHCRPGTGSFPSMRCR